MRCLIWHPFNEFECSLRMKAVQLIPGSRGPLCKNETMEIDHVQASLELSFLAKKTTTTRTMIIPSGAWGVQLFLYGIKIKCIIKSLGSTAQSVQYKFVS